MLTCFECRKPATPTHYVVKGLYVDRANSRCAMTTRNFVVCHGDITYFMGFGKRNTQEIEGNVGFAISTHTKQADSEGHVEFLTPSLSISGPLFFDLEAVVKRLPRTSNYLLNHNPSFLEGKPTWDSDWAVEMYARETLEVYERITRALLEIGSQ